MALIPCPECEKEVSDMAVACPHCGFPVAAAIRHAVSELTEDTSAKSVRQLHAKARLTTWGERYTGVQREEIDENASFIDRHWRALIFVVVALILVIQLTLVLSSVR